MPIFLVQNCLQINVEKNIKYRFSIKYLLLLMQKIKILTQIIFVNFKIELY